MAKLTGKTRFRSERKWGKERLILQVEEVVPTNYSYDRFYRDSPTLVWRDTNKGSSVLVWRDANTEDLTTIQIVKVK